MQDNHVPTTANTWPLVLRLCLLGCVVDQPYDSGPEQIQGRAGAMYLRGDGREVIECVVGRPPSMCGSVEVSGLPGQIYFDCSDEKFECLFNTADVLAVPRAGLALGQKYTAFGANLTVERCFVDEASCEIALIRSECADAETCSGRSKVPGRKTLFYFSRQLGITAFYTIGDLGAIGVDSKMLMDAIPLLTYILVAEKGFLRAPLSLQRASAASTEPATTSVIR